MGQGGDGASEGNMCWSIVWLIILIFVGFWLASLCAFLYVICSIFAACFEGMNSVCEFLLRGVQAAGTCAKHMVKGTPIGEAFK
ncbi:uncharacterized protein LOC127008335 [Eriocheir sinensis]|uniref:uncharacterized protein LOC127008335 n=1 Tax=Eriocheir sinensis TaxID=95602 RepID=UPI0021CA6177|nr:uncharacterized protein LOC127008335 [Eriocheir sinensis]XP_050736180.1 uncharacterized protein LOC127008335 [Eriocheir sinensis]XP_050736181.1 uncharacterized protein LOC127008335 [Eriocheir sinensis]